MNRAEIIVGTLIILVYIGWLAIWIWEAFKIYGVITS